VSPAIAGGSVKVQTHTQWTDPSLAAASEEELTCDEDGSGAGQQRHEQGGHRHRRAAGDFHLLLIASRSDFLPRLIYEEAYLALASERAKQGDGDTASVLFLVPGHRFHNLSQLMFLSSLPSLIGGEWTHESNRQILVFSLFQRFILKGVCVKMKYKRNF
jgi:hypothetical protein